MKKIVLSLLLGLTFCTASVCRSEEAKLNIIFKGKVSALGLPAEALGEDWTTSTGLVIDDFKDLSKYDVQQMLVVEVLKSQMTPIGVVATADFSYRKKSNPVHMVTVRVFLFDTDASCSRWWAQKYRHEGWKKYYTVVGGLPYEAVDSTEIAKRAVSFGNIWMTSHTLQKTNDHIRVLELFIDKIKSVAAGK